MPQNSTLLMNIVPQVCADPWEAGEHSRGSAKSVPGDSKDHAHGTYCGDEGI